MRTTADQDQILYDLLLDSDLNNELSGGLYKVERPQNSNLEDIVISSMLVTDGTLQEGVANVNIYIPKISVKISGQNQIMRDSKRISDVLLLAVQALKENVGIYYSLWTSKIQEFDEPQINQTRLNLRIESRIDDTII
jgi:hypothetical protein